MAKTVKAKTSKAPKVVDTKKADRGTPKARRPKQKYHATGYSRDFPASDKPVVRYMLDNIPHAMWKRVRAKCESDAVSMRWAILKGLTMWLRGQR